MSLITECILGSEAMEAAMKLARQYFLEISLDTPRYRFIAREGSWHGATISTLAVGDFKARKWPFEPLVAGNSSRVSACNPYRGLKEGESSEEYVVRLAQELEDEFQRLGPETVCAFIAEPMVGTVRPSPYCRVVTGADEKLQTLGCVNAVPGYFQAIKAICDRHGALLIFDEVMCGMGRTGTLHAWEQEDVVPDIQAIGKALGAGYAPVSALLIHERVIAGLKEGSGFFPHGQTYQSYPASCAAALEVQHIIQEENLLANVRCMGNYLGMLLRQHLEHHPNVGDIRGRGLFWAVEFVAEKLTKKPLDSKLNVAKRVAGKGLQAGYDISLFTASGSADGWHGDHFLLAPPYTVTADEVEEIVKRVVKVVDAVFDDINHKGKLANGVNGYDGKDGADGVGH